MTNFRGTIVIIFLLFFCDTSLNANNNYKIAVLYWSMNIPGQVAMRQGLEDEAKKINAYAKLNGKRGIEITPYVAGDGADGIENQIKQFKTALESRPDLIIIQPTDNAALGSMLAEANKKAIPVVAYDQYISKGELKAFITSNNYHAGFVSGEYIASLFPDDKNIKVVMVEYPHVSSTVERVDGFLDALNKYRQKYTIIKIYQAVEPISGKKAGEELLREFPKKGSVDVLFSVNDGGGLAVVDVLFAAGRTEIVHATIDGDPKSVENIKNGKLTVIDSAQFCGPLGAESLKVAMKVLTKEPTKNILLVPTFPITKDTLSIYPGWLGPIPESFKKPWPANETMWSNKVVEK